MQVRWNWWLLAFVVGCGTAATPVADTAPTADPPVIAEALALANKGEDDAGLKLLDAAIAQQADARLFGARATLHHRAGRTPQALEDLNAALAKSPDDPQLLNNRGFILLSVQNYDGAVADLNRALELKPDMVSGLNNRGLVSLALGKPQDAVVWFTKALKTNPEYVDAWNNRGFAWMQQERLEEAYADLNHALRLSPDYVNALHNRGLLRVKAGELQDAVLDFTDAMLLDPENPRYYQQRAATYQFLGKTAEGREDQLKADWLVKLQACHQAVKSQPRNAMNWIARANHYWNHGDEIRAAADLKRALELEPQSTAATVLQAKLAYGDQKYEEVVQLTTSLLETDEAVAAASVRGDALLVLGRYDEALDCFAVARRFDRSVAEAYFRKSQELSAAGETETAKERLEQALELDPQIERRLR